MDVATAGGWRTVRTLKDAYQQGDAETMLRVVLDAGELREARKQHTNMHTPAECMPG